MGKSDEGIPSVQQLIRTVSLRCRDTKPSKVNSGVSGYDVRHIRQVFLDHDLGDVFTASLEVSIGVFLDKRKVTPTQWAAMNYLLEVNRACVAVHDELNVSAESQAEAEKPLRFADTLRAKEV